MICKRNSANNQRKSTSLRHRCQDFIVLCCGNSALHCGTADLLHFNCGRRRRRFGAKRRNVPRCGDGKTVCRQAGWNRGCESIRPGGRDECFFFSANNHFSQKSSFMWRKPKVQGIERPENTTVWCFQRDESGSDNVGKPWIPNARK